MSGEFLEAAKAWHVQPESYSPGEVIEKPVSHSEERWQLFLDRGGDSWLGSVYARLVEKHGLDHVVLISLANLLIDRRSVIEGLELHIREQFDVTWSADRAPGANWAILSGDVLRGLQKSHADLMAVRGGLAWMLRKPLYPFRIGEHHSPRSPIPLKVDLSLLSRGDQLFVPGSLVFSGPEFSYHDWLQDTTWVKTFTDAGPVRVVFEPTNECAGNCVGCPQPLQTRARGFCATDLPEAIAVALQPVNDWHWVFSGMGEPLRHPEIRRLVAAGETRHSTLITGLQAPPPEDMPWKTLDLVRISVDAIEQTGFSTVRPGCDWSLVERFVREAAARKTADREHEPEIGISFLRHAKNAAWAMDFLRYWKRVCHPAFQSEFFLWPLSTPPENVQWFQILGASDFLGTQPKLFDVSYVPTKRRMCRHALTGFHVLWDGRVTICPFDFDGRFILGDLRQANAMDIWNSERAQAFRQTHIAGEFSEDIPCGACRDWYHPG